MLHHGGMASNNHESGDERPRPRPGDIADLAMRLKGEATEAESVRLAEGALRVTVMGLLEAAKRCAEPYVQTVGAHLVILDEAYDPEAQLTKFSSERLPRYLGALVRAADRAQVNVSTVASRLTAITGGGDVAADMENVLVAIAGTDSAGDDAATDSKALIDLVSRKHGGALGPIHFYFQQVVSALRVDGVHRVLFGAEQESMKALQVTGKTSGADTSTGVEPLGAQPLGADGLTSRVGEAYRQFLFACDRDPSLRDSPTRAFRWLCQNGDEAGKSPAKTDEESWKRAVGRARQKRGETRGRKRASPDTSGSIVRRSEI